MPIHVRLLALAVLTLTAAAARGQGTEVPFGGFSHDATLPVEITADALELDQAAGTALFTGGVRVDQGALRLASDRLQVFYADGGQAGGSAVQRMLATGNVTLTNGTEAAEAAEAVYDVAAGTVEMQGEVLLTQGGNALSSESLTIDLAAGTGRLTGRVQTIFTPGSEER